MQLTEAEAKILQKVIVNTLEAESKTTQRVIQSIPAENPNYKPDPASMSSLELAKHIATSELDFLHSVLKGDFDFSNKVPDSAKTPNDVAAYYGEQVARAIAELRTQDPVKAAQIMDFRGFLQLPAILFVNLAVNHSIHHRGQLSAHLRAAGGKVPSIYGPTYEDSLKQKSAAN